MSNSDQFQCNNSFHSKDAKQWVVHRCMTLHVQQPGCLMPPASISRTAIKTKAIFHLTEHRFSFIVNPDLDSLANPMVWIRECCRKWRHRYLFTFVILLFYCFARESTSKLDLLDSRIRIRVRILNGRIHWTQSESGFSRSNMAWKSDKIAIISLTVQKQIEYDELSVMK